ncbi:MAG: hypothetical protein ACYTJ0_19895 [Planctomycetota bacterium]|jgi:hypothetical protein
MCIAKSTLACLAFAAILSGCASTTSTPDEAALFIRDMDSRPPEEQVPNWEETRAMMLRGAPSVGDVAPDFELRTREGDGTIRLSEFQPTKPVVLIFGSWT